MMLQVTTEAARELRERLQAARAENDTSFRVVQSISNPDELCMAPDREKEGDVVVESEGRKILLLDADIALLLDDYTIDYRRAPDTEGFVTVKTNSRK
jgi:Fe-S cluster assembly iron-binding protein IscA